jgi:hypothetical protein
MGGGLSDGAVMANAALIFYGSTLFRSQGLQNVG